MQPTQPMQPMQPDQPVKQAQQTQDMNAEQHVKQQQFGGENGDDIKIVDAEKGDLIHDDEVIIEFLSNNNLCNRRFNILSHVAGKSGIKNFDLNEYSKDGSKQFTLNPTICDMNKDDKFNNLTDELGIPELEKLYFDEFDYVKGDYSSKSVNAKKIYTDDLKSFYETFTGNPFNPDIIKSFKDIKLRDFKYDEKCKDGQYKQEKKGRNITFKEYAIRLRLMLNNIITRQNKLIKILNNVFYINKKSNPVTVSIHYDLNEINLDKLIKETRVLIKELYIGCEKDFLHVLEIYFVLVNKVEYKTEIRQESNLKKLSHLNAPTTSIEKPMAKTEQDLQQKVLDMIQLDVKKTKENEQAEKEARISAEKEAHVSAEKEAKTKFLAKQFVIKLQSKKS